MEYNQLLNDFLDKCKKNDITTYNAKIATGINNQLLVSIENDDFINFCKTNNIRNIFIENDSETINKPINIETLKEDLQVWAENKLNISRHNYFFENSHLESFLGKYFKPLPPDFYEQAVIRIMKEMESDVIDYNKKCNNNPEKEVIYSIIAYTSYNGIIPFTNIFTDDEIEDDEINNSTEESFLNIYTQKLEELFNILRNSANRDYEKLKLLRQKDLKEELIKRIQDNPALPFMNTKKQRLEIANKLIAELYRTENYYFLNKEDFRDLVESAYYSLSQEQSE